MTKEVEITVCMGSACFARGNEQNLTFIENYIKEKKISANIELIGSRCEGKCAEGPNIIVNGIEYTKVDENQIKKILNKCHAEIIS